MRRARAATIVLLACITPPAVAGAQADPPPPQLHSMHPLGAAEEAESRYRLARALMEELEYHAALSHLSAVVSLTPTWALGQIAYAQCRRHLGLASGPTIAALRLSHRLAPSNPMALRELAVVFEEEERDGEASTVLEALLELVPRDAPAHGRLGALALESGDLEKARSHLVVASSLDPSDVLVATLLAEALERSGRRGQAAAELRRITDLNPDRPYLWRQLAAILDRAGDPKGAAATAARADKIEAKRKVVKRRMRPLRSPRRR